MSKRQIIIIAVLGLLLITLVVVGLRRATSTSGTPPASVTFTNAITGNSATDIVGQTNQLVPGVISQSGVTIDAIDNIYNYLSNDQGVNAQLAINSFLMARSGLASVHAGVKQNSMSGSGGTVTFTLVVIRPQVTYHVTISVANPAQTIPNVTFKEVD